MRPFISLFRLPLAQYLKKLMTTNHYKEQWVPIKEGRISINRKFLWPADIFITHLVHCVLFCSFNASNSIKNVIWLLTVEDSMVVCFVLAFCTSNSIKNAIWLLTVEDSMAHFLSSWSRHKNKWHFLLFPSFNHIFFAYLIPIILVSFHQMWLKVTNLHFSLKSSRN